MWSQAVTRSGRDTCQCAEMIRMPRASGCLSPNAASAAAWASPPNADMGDPCPTNTAGFRIVALWLPYQTFQVDWPPRIPWRRHSCLPFRESSRHAWRVQRGVEHKSVPMSGDVAGMSARATKCRLKFLLNTADEYGDRHGRNHSGWHRQRTCQI